MIASCIFCGHPCFSALVSLSQSGQYLDVDLSVFHGVCIFEFPLSCTTPQISNLQLLAIVTPTAVGVTWGFFRHGPHFWYIHSPLVPTITSLSNLELKKSKIWPKSISALPKLMNLASDFLLIINFWVLTSYLWSTPFPGSLDCHHAMLIYTPSPNLCLWHQSRLVSYVPVLYHEHISGFLLISTWPI